MTLPEFKPGKWKHFRGEPYRGLFKAHDSNFDGREVVVYKGKRGYAIRTVEDWFAHVCVECDGQSTVLPNYPGIPKCRTDWDHTIVRRFEYVGPIEDDERSG